jgi:hypothetical protein
MSDKFNPSVPLPASAIEYLKEEIKQRRTEIETLINRCETDKKDGLIYSGLLWAWLSTHVGYLRENGFEAVLFLPAFIIGFLFFRYISMSAMIMRIAEYLKQSETIFKVPPEFGWESWLDAWRAKHGKSDPVAENARWFWIFMFVMNVFLALVVTRRPLGENLTSIQILI